MSPIKKALARKAVKSTAKHTAHGTAAKIKREPLRAAALLILGGLLGLAVGWGLAHVSGTEAGGNQPA